MTPTKVINRLVEFGPAVIDPWFELPNHCVASTAIGIDVLRAFAIEAEPQPVHLQAANKILIDGLASCQGDPDWPALAAAGGWLVDTTHGIAEPKFWDGHLVIRVPKFRLIDLNLGQVNRPHKGIEVPAAATLAFCPPRMTYHLPHGAELTFQVSDDQRWRSAPDWADVARRREVVGELVRAIRKGRP